MTTARDAAFACLAAAQHGVFTPRQASELGFSRRERRTRVARGIWIELRPTVLTAVGAPDSRSQRRWAAYLEAGGPPRAAVSHASAAAVLGLPGFAERDRPDITKQERRRHELSLGRLHCNAWLPRSHVRAIDGLPVTTIARTVFDLAGDPDPHVWRSRKLLAVHDARIGRALDTSLQRLGNTLVEQQRVAAELTRRGRPGSAVMRRVLAERDDEHVPTESELEDLFLAVCDDFGLPSPGRQRVLGGEAPIGRVDFVYLDARLVIEVDGRRFHDSLTDLDHDRWRDNELLVAGFRVLRFRWRDLVDHPDRVARLVQQALGAAAA